MRRATAVRRLWTIAERCQQVCSLWEAGSGLVALHAFGSVLEIGGEEEPSIEVIQIALVVNEDAAEVTWCARPARFTGLPYVLDLEKAPVDWYFRPVAWPVGNHRIVRPLPIWTREDGVNEKALNALGARDVATLDRLREPAARPGVLARQLGEELAAASAHLERVRDAYWERKWRQAHHAAGMYPENYLWDAVHGYLDLRDAAEAPVARAAAAPPPDRERAGPVDSLDEVDPATSMAPAQPTDGTVPAGRGGPVDPPSDAADSSSSVPDAADSSSSASPPVRPAPRRRPRGSGSGRAAGTSSRRSS